MKKEERNKRSENEEREMERTSSRLYFLFCIFSLGSVRTKGSFEFLKRKNSITSSLSLLSFLSVFSFSIQFLSILSSFFSLIIQILSVSIDTTFLHPRSFSSHTSSHLLRKFVSSPFILWLSFFLPHDFSPLPLHQLMSFFSLYEKDIPLFQPDKTEQKKIHEREGTKRLKYKSPFF